MLESFLKILSGEPTDEIVWTADITYWMAGQKHAGAAPAAWDTERGYLQLCRDMGLMPYYWYDAFWLGEPVYDGVEFTDASSGDRRSRVCSTPVGELRQEWVFSAESLSEAIVKYPVESEDDLKVLTYLIEHRRLEPTCLDDYDRRRELWAEYDGLPSIALPRSPLPALFVEWAGVQNGVLLMTDYPQQVAHILALLDAQEQPILDAVCRHAPPLVHFADNLSAETYAGYFDAHMADGYRRRLRRLHEAGVRAVVHLDGTVRPLLGTLAAVGLDAVEALTPAPVGDVPVEQMRHQAGQGPVALWGGVPGAMFAPPYTWEQMRAHVQALVDAWKGTPFIVGVGDQVPPNGDITFCRKIAEAIEALQ